MTHVDAKPEPGARHPRPGDTSGQQSRREELAGPGSTRRGYLDWVRGIAVLVMIEAHVVDSWTAVPDRVGAAFAWAMVVGGFGAPLFLFLAGVAASLSAGSRTRRSGDVRAASRAVIRRGLEIFLLAFLFRIQAWVLGWSAPRLLLRVDILNIMGPSIVMAAALWGLSSTRRGRVVGFLVATLATAFLAPVIRTAPFIALLPDPVEAYLRPAGSMASFSLFPWAGFVFGGALLGVLLDGARRDPTSPAWSSAEGRLNLGFLTGGAALAAGAYAASFLPTLYAGSDFWTSSPAFFLLRVGLVMVLIGVSYTWEISSVSQEAWSPVRQLGRSSLFIYWIHVEMVYGLISLPLHHALTLRQTGLALFVFSLFMLACSIGKDRVATWWESRQETRARNVPPVLPSSL